MKNKLFLTICFMLVAAMLFSCAFETIDPQDESQAPANESTPNDQSQTIDELNLNSLEIKISEMSNATDTRYVPVSTTAEDLTEEEAEALALDLYDEIISIANEFYGSPSYLYPSEDEYHPYDDDTSDTDDDESYTKVMTSDKPDRKIRSVIEFPNDAEALMQILKTYLSDGFIQSAFSLEYPCAIHEIDGILYRADYDYGNGYIVNDIEAGRIILTENGIVRYAFPMYFLDYSTKEAQADSIRIGYLDFIYENNIWKVDDFALGHFANSNPYYPGGKAIQYEKIGDYFEISDNFTAENISVTVNGGKSVTLIANGKQLNTELQNPTNKISEVKNNGDNIFVTFSGILGNDETLVISAESIAIKDRFIANGYCLVKDNWFYIKIDREKKSGTIYDKNGTPIRECALAIRNVDSAIGLPEIAPIESFDITNASINIKHDITAYNKKK